MDILVSSRPHPVIDSDQEAHILEHWNEHDRRLKLLYSKTVPRRHKHWLTHPMACCHSKGFGESAEDRLLGCLEICNSAYEDGGGEPCATHYDVNDNEMDKLLHSCVLLEPRLVQVQIDYNWMQTKRVATALWTWLMQHQGHAVERWRLVHSIPATVPPVLFETHGAHQILTLSNMQLYIHDSRLQTWLAPWTGPCVMEWENVEITFRQAADTYNEQYSPEWENIGGCEINHYTTDKMVWIRHSHITQQLCLPPIPTVSVPSPNNGFGHVHHDIILASWATPNADDVYIYVSEGQTACGTCMQDWRQLHHACNWFRLIISGEQPSSCLTKALVPRAKHSLVCLALSELDLHNIVWLAPVLSQMPMLQELRLPDVTLTSPSVRECYEILAPLLRQLPLRKWSISFVTPAYTLPNDELHTGWDLAVVCPTVPIIQFPFPHHFYSEAQCSHTLDALLRHHQATIQSAKDNVTCTTCQRALQLGSYIVQHWPSYAERLHGLPENVQIGIFKAMHTVATPTRELFREWLEQPFLGNKPLIALSRHYYFRRVCLSRHTLERAPTRYAWQRLAPLIMMMAQLRYHPLQWFVRDWVATFDTMLGQDTWCDECNAHTLCTSCMDVNAWLARAGVQTPTILQQLTEWMRTDYIQSVLRQQHKRRACAYSDTIHNIL